MTYAAHRSVVVAPATSQLEKIEVRAPGPRELLIQVVANGLCASELPAWSRGPTDGAPMTLGHEPVGRVVEVGGGVGRSRSATSSPAGRRIRLPS